VKRLSAVRRWLTYLTLFVAVTVLVGDVITLVYKLLGGEFTVRFGLKVLVAAIIASAIFGYYLRDLSREEREEPATAAATGSAGRWLAIAASVVMAATVVAAIVVTGTPGQRRLVKLDDRRTDDLRALERAIDEYYKQHGRLPGQLLELYRKPGSTAPSADPQTRQPYDYAVLAERRYRLCAVFATDTGKTDAVSVPRWQHGIGRHCFDIDTPKPEDP
jgi:hypothetical protein